MPEGWIRIIFFFLGIYCCSWWFENVGYYRMAVDQLKAKELCEKDLPADQYCIVDYVVTVVNE